MRCAVNLQADARLWNKQQGRLYDGLAQRSDVLDEAILGQFQRNPSRKVDRFGRLRYPTI
jgi:hypothetical protein